MEQGITNQIGIILIGGFSSIWLFILTIYFIKISKHYKKLTNVSPGALDQVLEKILKEMKLNADQIKLIEKKYQEMTKEQKRAISCFSLVKFNPFGEVGGKQSFAAALLDKTGAGIILTAFHNRDSTRIYAKMVKGNKSGESELSEEEKLAIKQALRR